MTRSIAPRRYFRTMQERRRRAVRLFAAGKHSQAEDGVSGGMARVRQSKLPFSFLHHAGLYF